MAQYSQIQLIQDYFGDKRKVETGEMKALGSEGRASLAKEIAAQKGLKAVTQADGSTKYED